MDTLTHEVYRITHKQSGKVYIGQTCDSERRFKEHCKPRRLTSKNNDNKSWSSLVHRAIAKYGKDDFLFEIVETCTEENINEREVYHIERENCLHPRGYNLLKGGSGTSGGHHEESKRKMSESHMGKIITDITKARMSASRLGPLNPAYGGEGTFVTPVAQYSLKGEFIKTFKSCTEAARHLGLPILNARVNIGGAARGATNTAFDFQWRQKDLDTDTFPERLDSYKNGVFLKRRPIIGIDRDGNEILYDSIISASKILGIKCPNISACLNKSREKAKGFRWKYAEVDEKKELIQRVHKDTQEKETFNSIEEAAKSVGSVPSKIRLCLTGGAKSLKGYTWSLASDNEESVASIRNLRLG